MAENKTRPTPIDPRDFIATVENGTRRRDALALLDLFAEVTGWPPRLWGDSIIGFGRYHYRYDSGREGDFLATGFSPRKAAQSIYIMPGYGDFAPLLDRLGPHRTGKSCLYITQLARVDTDVLRQLIAAGLERLRGIYPVHAQ
ncbi:DUF1801 domain-containing protein [Pseudooceanicola aestuarii]|uniref:DUF1801 domain-containing protein n=1 Tax=Pseudooceanicola aestuarii TaxID=2697319 RepID=UPI0013D55522|nr:DUF1801 domain-containing protein [Pseudooceanicola aestuarii]